MKERKKERKKERRKRKKNKMKKSHMYLVYGLGWRFEGVVDDGGEGLQWSNAAFSIYVSPFLFDVYLNTNFFSKVIFN